MTREEYSQLTKEFTEAQKEHRAYVKRFFTTVINNRVVQEADKAIDLEEAKKIREMRNKVHELEKEWWRVVESSEKLEG